MWKEILKRQQKLYKPTPQVDLDLQSIDGLEFNPDILAESRKREDSRQLEEKRRQFQSKREGMKKLGQKTLDIEKAPLSEIRKKRKGTPFPKRIRRDYIIYYYISQKKGKGKYGIKNDWGKWDDIIYLWKEDALKYDANRPWR